MTDATSVFLSYSRRDLAVADEVAELLRRHGLEVLRDLDDILPTEAWRDRLGQLIEAADAVVFLLSPASAASEVCAWEVEYADHLHKKIAPIVVTDVAGAEIPPLLSRLNYIFATDASRIENAVLTLCDALSGAAEWIREHTKLTQRALRFAETGARSELLTSGELQLALMWLAQRPRDVPAVSRLVQRLVEESQRRDDEMRRFSEEKIRAIERVIGPVVAERVAALESEAKRHYDASTFVKVSAHTEGLRSQANTLRNVMESHGRWHPQPAAHLKTLSAREDYSELYQFPCCGHYLVLANPGTPFQFRADGCQTDPHGPGERTLFVVEPPRLKVPPLDYRQDIEPSLSDWQRSYIQRSNINPRMVVSVAVDEQGGVAGVELLRATADTEIDQAVKAFILSRYSYEPAADAQGRPVAAVALEEIPLPHWYRDAENRQQRG